MIIPIRCFTCGKVIANRWNFYQKKKREYSQLDDNKDTYIDIEQLKLNKQQTPEFRALNDCKLDRICCRRMFLSHTDLVNTI